METRPTLLQQSPTTSQDTHLTYSPLHLPLYQTSHHSTSMTSSTARPSQHQECVDGLIKNGHYAHFVPSCPSAPFTASLNKEPLGPHRFLLLTSILYRTWGKIRLSHLQPWTESWRHEAMFGGMPSVGADDAFYTTALEKELCIIENRPYVGRSLDLYKCFDQVLRPLLYIILLISGLPTQ
eukprot:12425837-Karenia_brevis.AAC.1